MTGAELKAWVSRIPDDFEVEFYYKDQELQIASLNTAPWDKLATQHFITGMITEKKDNNVDQER